MFALSFDPALSLRSNKGSLPPLDPPKKGGKDEELLSSPFLFPSSVITPFGRGGEKESERGDELFLLLHPWLNGSPRGKLIAERLRKRKGEKTREAVWLWDSKHVLIFAKLWWRDGKKRCHTIPF